MNENIQKIAEKYREQLSKISIDCDDDVIYYDNVEDLVAEVVTETINEFCQQLWNYGIDGSNNPNFYKAQQKTEQYFGVKSKWHIRSLS